VRDTYPGSVHIQAAIDSLTTRWKKVGLPDFVWWIPLVFFSANVVAIVVAVGQRFGNAPALPVLALGLLALVPCLLDATAVARTHWTAYLVCTIGATVALAILYPVAVDFAPVVWIITAGHFGATERFKHMAIAWVATCSAIVVMGLGGQLDAWPLWLLMTIVGFDTGFILQYQQRALDRTKQEMAARELQAVLEERQRIAREVHDVVAHSLSVTMLHLTAARRDLESDGSEGIDDALDALRDAEHQGRRAMTDIRHAVGLLGTTGGDVRSAPDAADVPVLVEQFRSAGLDVHLDLHGSAEAVPSTTSLSIYRIVQESLANVAKHQPGARVGVVLDVNEDRQALRVWNSLSGPVVEKAGGSGITGMRQRAELLGGSFNAGPRDGAWMVQVEIPSGAARSCRLGLPRVLRAGSAADPGASPA
jgi:signal transduction histidine kinase